ncbi:MAG: glutamate racemase [Salibacteraceae bacterium]
MSIGFFDSGVGGLTIWREVVRVLPCESTIYIADSLNAPYGEKSTEEVIQLSISNTKKLIDLGAKVIVVACNTATTQAISTLRREFNIPFVGIEPAIKPAANSSLTKMVGVLATHGTIESEHFNKAKETYSDGVQIITQVGEGLVRLIEEGKLDSIEMDELLKKHINELVQFPIDRLVLGCTHYPLLKPQIKRLINENIHIIDSGIPVATQVKRVFENLKLNERSDSKHSIISSGEKSVIKKICAKELDVGELDIHYSSLYQSE